jgi:hypothetical protein
MAADPDDRLLGRLRQLSLVELDALLAGATGARRAELREAHAGDVADAVAQARRRMDELCRAITAGPDPLLLCDAAPAVRARNAAGPAAVQAAQRLSARAAACRDLARLDDACALLVPRLVDLDRVSLKR